MSAAAPSTEIDEDDEDVIDGVIRKTGCEEQYRAMENCLAFETNRDFRACAKVMKDFQECMAAKKAGKQ